MLADPPAGTAVTVGLVLVLVGAFTKSAQYPFHSWLPGAMVAPTPISAYLHSATMVKAGVYLVGRFGPAFTRVWIWRPLVVTVGLVTMVAGGLRALRQHDLKLILAFGTYQPARLHGRDVRASARPTRWSTRAQLVLAHALFKAALFMVVGIVDHQAGTRDIRRLPPPGRRLAADGGGRDAGVGGVDGRRAADVRVRRQGGGLRRPSSRGLVRLGGPGARPRWCWRRC